MITTEETAIDAAVMPRVKFKVYVTEEAYGLMDRLSDAFGVPMNGVIEGLSRQEAQRMGVYRRVGDATDWGSMIIRRKGVRFGQHSETYTALAESRSLNTTLTAAGFWYLQQIAEHRNIALNVTVEMLVRQCAKREKILEG